MRPARAPRSYGRSTVRAPAAEAAQPGLFPLTSETVYPTVVDAQRNCCSFINSLYIVAPGTGVCLQNRGACFVLREGHPNCVGPHKRPLHTIIPALVMRGGRPWLSFGVMGGDMQPQGHLQVLCNVVDFGMAPQEAVEAPRFRHFDGLRVAVERPAYEEVAGPLQAKGHKVQPADPRDCGGGQLIEIDPRTGALAAGSDPRKDGCAVGY